MGLLTFMKQTIKEAQAESGAKSGRIIATVMGKTYIVQCKGFRCAAYVDNNGKWRGLYSHEEILGPVTIDSDFE